jgi:hypothetical protein
MAQKTPPLSGQFKAENSGNDHSVTAAFNHLILSHDQVSDIRFIGN